jgi:hypothetical protein
MAVNPSNRGLKIFHLRLQNENRSQRNEGKLIRDHPKRRFGSVPGNLSPYWCDLPCDYLQIVFKTDLNHKMIPCETRDLANRVHLIHFFLMLAKMD